jgi:hypothetical protein
MLLSIALKRHPLTKNPVAVQGAMESRQSQIAQLIQIPKAFHRCSGCGSMLRRRYLWFNLTHFLLYNCP